MKFTHATVSALLVVAMRRRVTYEPGTKRGKFVKKLWCWGEYNSVI